MSMLIFTDEMYHFLQFAQRDSIIAALFLQGDSSHINNEGNYISRVEDEIDVVSFLPKSKYEKVEDNWENGRVKIKNRKPNRTILFIIKPHAIIRLITTYRKCHSKDIKKPWNFMVYFF